MSISHCAQLGAWNKIEQSAGMTRIVIKELSYACPYATTTSIIIDEQETEHGDLFKFGLTLNSCCPPPPDLSNNGHLVMALVRLS